MTKIEHKDKVYALHSPITELKEGTEWFGAEYEPLQASRLCYNSGKKFKAHFHTVNPRVIARTEEAFIVVSGRITVNMYHEVTKDSMGSLCAIAGDIVMIFFGFHELVIEEDNTVLYEVKSGSFTSVYQDKEFLE